ncbi:MAG: alpha-galactosidase [Candidatus Spyradocola sp.]|jgi:alpha-galactosidase
MAITVLQEKKIFKLDTESSSYVLGVMGNGVLVHLYYGAAIEEANLEPLAPKRSRASFWAIQADAEDDFSADILPLEYSGAGSADLRAPAIATVDADGDNVTDLRYDSYEVLDGKPDLPGLPHTYLNPEDEAQTLRITLRDAVKNLYVDLYYTTFAFSDAICRWAVARNEGGAPLTLTRVMSASLAFPGMEYDLIHLHGAWAREFHMERTPIPHGEMAVSSFRGASSHLHNPFAALVRKDATETQGEVYGVSLVYSGNFRIETEVDAFDELRLNCGINDRGFTWRLEPGESFCTPEAVLVYSGEGLSRMSRTYHRLYRRNLARGKYRDQPRPILLNSWEGVYMDFDANKLLEMAKSAADLGIEMFVLDDGWFGARDNDRCALGDWVVNEKKLGCSLHDLVEQIKALGLSFGLWFEPEMISPDSDLYRAHPEYALRQSKRAPSLGRHQLILDMTRKDVQDYVVEAVSAVLRSADIRYVKWDMNRNMAEVGSASLPPDRQGEVFHRYILGVYSVMERITSAFPNVLFESCSGGGGRFDAGLLYYMPQNWTSDDSDAIERLTIQYGCSLVYPPSAMTCHVSAVPNHQVGRVTPFQTRGAVAMLGSFGYELDMSKLSKEERAQVRNQVGAYKCSRYLVAQGDLYRLLSPLEGNDAAFLQVSDDKSLAMLTYVQKLAEPNPAVRRVRLRGLEPLAHYYCEQDRRTYDGATLMNAGYVLPEMHGDFDSVRLVFRCV